MNIDSYWADEDDWDDEFCYREINPFDDSAACMALGAFTTAARTAHVILEKKELPTMMGNNGGDDNDTIPFGMPGMCAEEYLNGMADDSWLCDPCDWEVGSYPETQDRRLPKTKYPEPEKHPEYILIPHAEIIGETNRAIRVTTPICSEPFWLPKSVVIQINNEITVVHWFYEKEIKTKETFAAVKAKKGQITKMLDAAVHTAGLAASNRLANSTSSKKSKAFMVEQTQKQQHCCPYCGGVGCDCGEDLD